MFLFFRFGAVQPIYINLIRHPLARFVSSYYYRRFGDHTDGHGRTPFKGRKKDKNRVCATLLGQDNTLNYVTKFLFLKHKTTREFRQFILVLRTPVSFSRRSAGSRKRWFWRNKIPLTGFLDIFFLKKGSYTSQVPHQVGAHPG